MFSSTCSQTSKWVRTSDYFGEPLVHMTTPHVAVHCLINCPPSGINLTIQRLNCAGLAPVVNQIQYLTQSIRQWLAQLALAYLKLALIARTDLLTYATLATHDSHSLRNMMTASCTLIISSKSCHIATWF